VEPIISVEVVITAPQLVVALVVAAVWGIVHALLLQWRFAWVEARHVEISTTIGVAMTLGAALFAVPVVLMGFFFALFGASGLPFYIRAAYNRHWGDSEQQDATLDALAEAEAGAESTKEVV
jgi:hypothetical protein